MKGDAGESSKLARVPVWFAQPGWQAKSVSANNKNEGKANEKVS
jgi:hypothetical protein